MSKFENQKVHVYNTVLYITTKKKGFLKSFATVLLFCFYNFSKRQNFYTAAQLLQSKNEIVSFVFQ